MMSEKIGTHHRARKAVLYVRQSSAHQVQHNRESRTLQYAMRDRLMQLGWSEIEIIDEDLGLSAAGGTARAGFERMVAEVCLGKVGAVAAREVSRFARNSRDWQQLVEMCRVVDTLLMARNLHPGQRNSLDALCKRYGVDNSTRTLHGALLDCELLAQVYLSMTRGQETLIMEPSGTAGALARAAMNKQSPRPLPAPLPEEDLAAHDALLRRVDKESGGTCLWLKEQAD